MLGTVAAIGLGALALGATPMRVDASAPRASYTLNGAGSTFIEPIMTAAWIPDYQKNTSSVQINYRGIGSGSGIAEWIQGKIDFAGSDALLNAQQLSSARNACVGGPGGGVFAIPATIGAVAIIYNLPGVKNLRLSSSVLAGIYLGKITAWNDPAIEALNKGVNLPSTPIHTVHRADGSGTTYIFTSYLAAVSKDWLNTAGKGSSTVKWPSGNNEGAQGSNGLSAAVGQTQGAIGYVDLAYAIGNNLSYARVQNKSGRFIAPSTASASAAASSFLRSMPPDRQQVIVNSSAATAYPIAGYSYIFMCTRQTSAKGQALVRFVRYVVTDGQKAAAARYYAPLPKNVQNLDTRALDTITR